GFVFTAVAVPVELQLDAPVFVRINLVASLAHDNRCLHALNPGLRRFQWRAERYRIGNTFKFILITFAGGILVFLALLRPHVAVIEYAVAQPGNNEFLFVVRRTFVGMENKLLS